MTGPIEQDRLSFRPPGATPGRGARLAACLALVLAIVPARLAADDGIAGKRVLIMHADNVFLPANQIMDRVLSSALIGAGLPTASIYAEYMEAGRFAEPAQQEAIIRLFREKYRNLKIDLVIVTDDTTLDYVAGKGPSFLPDAPVLFCAVTAGKDIPESLGKKVTGNLKTLDIAACIAGIRALQPELRELVFITGTGSQDAFYRSFLDEALEKSPPPGVTTRILSDLPLVGSLAEVAALPPGSAVLVLSVYRDGAGVTYNPRDAMARIAKTSSVPVYGISDTYVGTGFVGGNCISFTDLATDAAAIAVRILKGTDPSTIPVEVFPNRNYFDWNMLKRWNLPLSRVPAGSVLWNSPPDFWALYHRQALAAICILVAVAGFALALAMQLSLRKKAERKIRENEYLLDRIVQTNPCMLYIYDIAGRSLTFSNRKLWEILGIDSSRAGELGAVLLDSYLHPDDLQRIREHYASMADASPGHGDAWESEYRIRAMDGKWRWFRGTDTVFAKASDGRATAILGSSVEVTHEKETEERLLSAIKEKDVLLRELHHRTKNNLNLVCSLLRLHSQSLPDEASRRVFEDMEDRILSMSLVHEKLYQTKDLSRISLRHYFEELARLFSESYGDGVNRLRFVLDIEDLSCPADIAVTLGLFCNELILNSCRHAFREGEGGSISLDLSKGEGDEITLLYSDDGTGLPAGCDLRREGHVGTQTLIALGEVQLRGRLEFSGPPGFSCLLRFTADLPAFTA